MSLFRVDKVACLLSESLVSAFITGTAVHVFVSQMKDLLGLKIPRYTGVLKIIKVILKIRTFYYIIKRIIISAPKQLLGLCMHITLHSVVVAFYV